MQKRIALLALFGFVATIASFAQKPSPPESATCDLGGGKSVKTNYSSPRMRGRKVYGELVPFGQVWRTGANEATTFVASSDITVGGTAVPAGSYTIFTVPAFGYLSKSFSQETLADTIRRVLETPAWDDGIEVISATPQLISLAVRCQIVTAERLLQFLGEITDLPESECHDVGIAFREMLLNAMEHGGNFDPNKYVEVCYVRTKHVLMTRIRDPGDGFTLEEVWHAAIGNPPDDPLAHVKRRNDEGMRPGGYGVMLAKNLVDELIYGEKGNEVLLVKYLPGYGANKA